MLLLKIMSATDRPDTDPWKGFRLIPIQDSEVLEFAPITSEEQKEFFPTAKYLATVTDKDGNTQWYPLTGNAYVMNAQGKTIATHAS